MGCVQRMDNVPYSSGQRLLVSINAHELSGGTLGV